MKNVSNKVKKGKHCITYTLQLGAQSAPVRPPATFGRANSRMLAPPIFPIGA